MNQLHISKNTFVDRGGWGEDFGVLFVRWLELAIVVNW